jgi:hypothetical protein
LQEVHSLVIKVDGMNDLCNFSRKGVVEMQDKHRPYAQSKRYVLLECPYCGEDVHVAHESYASQEARRVHDHLCVCSEFHWTVPCLRRERGQSLSPLGRESGRYTQLNIANNGHLERHQLGSLLPGRPRPLYARE